MVPRKTVFISILFYESTLTIFDIAAQHSQDRPQRFSHYACASQSKTFETDIKF